MKNFRGQERRRRPTLMTMILGSVAMVAATAQPAWAQQPAAKPANSQSVGTFSFDQPAKPLSQALNDVSRVTGLTILYTEEDTRSLTSPRLNGRLTAEQALRAVLAGSGYGFSYVNANTVTLVRQQGAADGDALVLDPVTVEGTGSRPQDAWGPVRGYVATRSATATKTDTPLAETPQSVSVVTREQMEDRAVQSVPQAVRYTAGVVTESFGYDPRFDQIYVRGFEVHSSSDYRDGLRQLSSGMAYFRTDPYALERVDILKGPSSVLFGQGSPGGLINRVTKRPTETAMYEIDGQVGSDDRYQGAFDVSGPVNRNVLYRLTGLLRDSETQVEGGEDDRMLVAPAVTLRNDSTSLTLLGHLQKDESDGSLYHFQGNGELTKVRVSDPSFDELAQDQQQVGYMLEHRWNDVVTLRQNLRYGHVDIDLAYLALAGTNTGSLYDRTAYRTEQALDAWTVDNQIEGKFATGPVRHILTGGFDYQKLDQEQSWAWGAAPALDVNNPGYGVSVANPAVGARTGNEMEQMGLYAQDQVRIGDKWHAVAGLRQDWVERSQTNLLTGVQTSEKEEQALTGRIGALYASETGLSPFASYATSFFPNTNTGADGKILDPTTGQQYEVGVKFQPKGINSFATASLFHLTQQNVAKQVGATNVYVQTGEVRSRGLELEGVADLSEGVRLIGSYTYVDAKVLESTKDTETGQRPVVTPRHTASLWGDYTLPEGMARGLGFGAGVRYVGDTHGDRANTVKNDAYTLFDAAIHYDLDNLRFALNANNVFDKEVKTNNEGDWYWGAGRTVIGSVKVRW